MKNIKNKIVISAQQLIERLQAEYPKFIGRRATIEEIKELQNKLTINLPDWYIDLYSNVEIIDAEFGFQEFEVDGDYDGISYLIVGDIKAILEESLEYIPGMNVLEKGYIFFGSCSHGSGDSLFLNLMNEENHDPPVFRIYHDDNSIDQISNSISELLINAKV